MSEFVYKDYLPANARVIVDYKKEQKVSFSYPINWTYKKAVWKRAFPVILNWWLFIHIIPLLYLSLLVIPILFFASIFFSEVFVAEAAISYFDFWHIGLPIISEFVYMLGIPAFLTWYLARSPERLGRLVPKFGYWTSRMLGSSKEINFLSKDVLERKCVIPSFGNVYLDYKAEGEFNDYLEKVEILEIPFNYLKKRLFFKSKREKNDYVFRAVFYFSKTPRKGSLTVEFI